MPREYTIAKILPTKPKLWKNGIVYYEVELVGYPRPVSVGKKQPPQEGWTIYGNIEETPDGLADKFTSATRPEPQGKDYQGKDANAIKAMWAIGQATQIAINTTVKENFPYMENIKIMADQLFSMVDWVKQGTEIKELDKMDRGDFASVEQVPIEAYDE